MSQNTDPTSTSPAAQPTFRYFDLVMAAFVTVLLLSNIIGAAKLSAIPLPGWPNGWWPAPEGMFIFGAGILLSPFILSSSSPGQQRSLI